MTVAFHLISAKAGKPFGKRSCWRLLILCLLAACQPNPISTPPTPTALPTFDAGQSTTLLCRDVDTAWGASDWPRVIKDLETVERFSAQCGDHDPALKLYPAYYNYGVALDAAGDSANAIEAYRQALMVNPNGQEAALALQKHAAFTPQPLATCTPEHAESQLAAVPVYQPAGSDGFVTIQGAGFAVEGAPFMVHGINYYPARAPWRRFLTDATPDAMTPELDLIKAANFNTIRIFLWYDALFECPGSGTVPKPEAFVRLDAVIKLAAARGLRILITLNDLADLTFHPLYMEPDSAAAQTAYIVMRYRDESAILGWDLRNEGDIDYIRGFAAAHTVLDWLAHTASMVRALDSHHLITAGWNEDSQATVGAVDFVSFHHWGQASALHERVAALRIYTQKPILLEEIGYSTRAVGEATQADLLHQSLDSARAEGLAGWVVWTAFDYTPDVTCVPPACPGADNAEHHFGLWRADYSPKPVVQVVEAQNTH